MGIPLQPGLRGSNPPPGLGLRAESPVRRRLQAAERQSARAAQRTEQARTAMLAAQKTFAAEKDAWERWMCEVTRLQAEAAQQASNGGDVVISTESDWFLI